MTFRVLTSLCACLLLLTGTAAASDVPPGLAATWRAVGEPDAERERAIERVVERMSVFKRGMARKALEESVPLCRQVRIWETTDGQLAIQCDDGRAAVAPPDGSSRTWTTPDGHAYTLTHRVEGGRVLQTFRGKRGTKESEWVLTGGELRLRVRIRSPHLPVPLEYDQVFVS